MSNKAAPAASAAIEEVREVVEHESVDADEVIFGSKFVFDLELAGDASTVTVFEGGIPRLKQSMRYADIERLLDRLSTLPASWRP